jgi:hypothetical protein
MPDMGSGDRGFRRAFRTWLLLSLAATEEFLA